MLACWPFLAPGLFVSNSAFTQECVRQLIWWKIGHYQCIIYSMMNRLYCLCLELLMSLYSFSSIFLLFCEGCWKWDKEWSTRWGSTTSISSCWSKSQVFIIGKQGTQSSILTSFCVCISEAVWAPLNLPALVTENFSSPPDRIFWKAILLLPSDHDSVSNMEDRWADRQMFDYL